MDPAIGPYRAGLLDRCDAVLRSLPDTAVLNAWAWKPDRAFDGAIPSWMLLPIWLNQAWATSTPGMLDILWGQYALFLSIRLQDDLLDRHVTDLRLQFVADRFLIESLASLQTLSELDESFWRYYRHCLRETVDGIFEVHGLEERAAGFTEGHLHLHAKVGAIFKIGTAAVCDLNGRWPETEWTTQLQDQLAIFSQICDDLGDVVQDVAKGRYTYVGNTLIGACAGEPITPEQARRRLGEGLIRPSRSEHVWTLLGRAASAAAAAAAAADPAPHPLQVLLQSLETTPSALRDFTRETRMRWLLGDALVASGT
jgi:hypothetical protein